MNKPAFGTDAYSYWLESERLRESLNFWKTIACASLGALGGIAGGLIGCIVKAML